VILRQVADVSHDVATEAQGRRSRREAGTHRERGRRRQRLLEEESHVGRLAV